jgi:serine/threonine protein kinase
LESESSSFVEETQSSSLNLIKKYEVLDGLGYGGFSTVVKVEEIHSKQKYAMKVISKKRDSSLTYQNRLKLELEIMLNNKNTQGPFLQQCLDSFENVNTLYFITDLIKGGDLFFHLTDRIPKNKSVSKGFKENEAKNILAELYLAIEHLHKYKYIHRDIKIENVMLDRKGHVKLVDFGLATRLE